MDRAFHQFPHNHTDLVLSLDYDYYGTRLVTASSDHKLTVWTLSPSQNPIPSSNAAPQPTINDLDPSIPFPSTDNPTQPPPPSSSSSQQSIDTETWTILDTWTAHSAEVTSVKWNGPLSGSHLASISEDGLLRIWAEDVLSPPLSNSRFKKIYEQMSPTRVPYTSLDFKNIGNETVLALITRDGQLTVMEPIELDDFSEWSVMWCDYLVKTPSRTEETGFCVSWHKERLPCWTAICSGLDRKSLGLAVSIGETVKVYRTDRERKFYVACELSGAKGLIRYVAWSNGSLKGYDTIATACRDGMVRVYELHTPGAENLGVTADALKAVELNQKNNTNMASKSTVMKSGIGVGLAGSNTSNSTAGNKNIPPTIAADDKRPGKVVQEARMVAELPAHEGAVWRVGFSSNGDILLSTGDDGLVNVWKRDVSLQWTRYADIDAAK